MALTLNRQGFVMSVELDEGAGATIASRQDPGATTAHKDRPITRLAFLKAAAEYAASKTESTSTDVLTIAAS